MSDYGQENKWVSPGAILGALGMLGAVAGAWSSFDARTAVVEANYHSVVQRLDRIENKLDAISEYSRGERGR